MHTDSRRVIQEAPRNWGCLAHGDEVQRRTFQVLSELQIHRKFQAFDPVHVGTIGNGLYVEGSDIDIVMCASDLSELQSLLADDFGKKDEFLQRKGLRREKEYVVTTFIHTLPVEIYAECAPVEQQWGYRHYRITCRLLALSSDLFSKKVREMKRAGIKTEPAIAQCLGLSGDPYAALLALESHADDELLALMKPRGLSA